MQIYRLAKKAYIQDLSGQGARLYGGRWNKKGQNMLYTSESRSLATLEYLVHLPRSLLPKDTCLAVLEVPDSVHCQTLEADSLPPDWMQYPAPPSLAELGGAWKLSLSSLILKVPSAVVRQEWNLLVNPDHPDFAKIRLIGLEEQTLDPRLK